MIRRLPALAAMAAIAVVVGACGGGERELVGFERDPAPAVDVAALPDVAEGGAPFEFRAPEGGLLVVYFGYTNCPDICPTTMADVRTALGELGDDAERIDVAMVTVDPGRDTDVLAEYVRGFVPDGHAIATDDQAALQSVAAPFAVSYEVQTSAGGEVEVGHSTDLYVVDDQGTLVLTWPLGTSADDLAGDLEQLLG